MLKDHEGKNGQLVTERILECNDYVDDILN